MDSNHVTFEAEVDCNYMCVIRDHKQTIPLLLLSLFFFYVFFMFYDLILHHFSFLCRDIYISTAERCYNKLNFEYQK